MFVAASTISGLFSAGGGVFFLGHHVSWNSDRARVAGAGSVDVRALHGFGEHPAGGGVLFEGAHSARTGPLVHRAIWSDDQWDRNRMPGVRRAVGAERTGVSVHYALAILVRGYRRRNSGRRTIARADPLGHAGGTGGHHAIGGSGHRARGFRRPDPARIPDTGRGLHWLVPGLHFAAPA